MELGSVDNLVLSLVKATKLPIEAVYRSKGGEQPLSEVQMMLDEDDGFPIPDYFLIFEGKEDCTENKFKYKYAFTRYIENFIYKYFNEMRDISTLHADDMNHDTLKEDGFECIWRK